MEQEEEQLAKSKARDTMIHQNIVEKDCCNHKHQRI